MHETGRGQVNSAAAEAVLLCASQDLVNGGDAVAFDVLYCGRNEHAFAIRFADRVHAYLNRCAHVPMEMDYQPNKFFDTTGHYLICATHGALYSPETGACQGGPCRGGLVKISVTEQAGFVHWHTADHLKSVV